MNHPLMEYLSPVGQQPQQPQAPQNLPPLSIATASKDYFGRKAYDYDLDRENSQKWQAEYRGITEGIRGIDGTVLDIPCGTGRFFPIYKEAGLNIIGMDISDDMLCQITAKHPWAEGLDIRQVDITKGIPLPDKSVDATVCSQFLKFATEPELASALKEIGRVTKQRILCSLHVGNQLERRNRNWVHRFPVFKDAVDAAGFRIVANGPIEPQKGHHLWLCEAA